MSLSRLTAARAAWTSGALAAGHVVRTRRDGRALHVTINRPTQLNAIDHDVVTLLRATLDDAADEPEVETIVLSGAGPRGFSAGGDLVRLRQDGVTDGGWSMPYWRDLYDLALVIAELPKPIVAVMDGFVLGGALGLAARASHRVVTERSVVGMPETRIGFFPDVGGLHLLSHLPGEVGTYLGLCAETLGGADAVEVGLADHVVLSDDLPRLLDALATRSADDVLAAANLSTEHLATRDLAGSAWIRECFAGDDPAVVVERLLRHEHPDARAAGDVLAQRSPTAVTATLLGLRRAATLDLPTDLRMELALAEHLRRSHDFLEGIRARLVDKDRAPTWDPASFDDVDAAGLRAAMHRP